MNNILEMAEQEIWDLFESKSFRIGDLNYLIKNYLVEQDEDDPENYLDSISGILIDEDYIKELQNHYNDPKCVFVEQVREIDMEDKSFLFVRRDNTSRWYPLSLIIPMDCHLELIHLNIPDEEIFML